MTKLPEIETAAKEIVPVLSVSPIEQDHVALAQIFGRFEWTVDQNLVFEVDAIPTLPSAVEVLRECQIPIVVCESESPWKKLLDHSARLPVPPLLIVTSGLADERLWAEALNLGAYDVLAKPFDAQEVCRVVEGAWHRWRDQHVRTVSAGAAYGDPLLSKTERATPDGSRA